MDIYLNKYLYTYTYTHKSTKCLVEKSRCIVTTSETRVGCLLLSLLFTIVSRY